MNRGQEITQKLQNAQKAWKDLEVLFGSERVSFELIRGDIEALEEQKKKLLVENQTIEEGNRLKAQTGEKIEGVAKEKTDEILAAAHARNLESMQLLETVKKFVSSVDKKVYKELNEKAAANVGN